MRIGLRKRVTVLVAAVAATTGTWVAFAAQPAAATPALTISASTNLVAGQKVTWTATGFTPFLFGSITECNGDPTQPTVTIQGNAVPVGCSPVSLALIPSSGTQTGTFTIIKGTTGPPAGGLDSLGNQGTVDAPNYPCPPTNAQINAGVTCAIAFGDTSGLQAFVIIHFQGEPPPTITTTTTIATTTTTAPPNPLVVNAGGPVSGPIGSPIALHGSATDPSGTPSFQWSIDSLGCAFADSTAADTTVTCAQSGVFAATLTANDGINPPATDTAQVTVLSGNTPPTVNAGPNVSGLVGDDLALNGTVTDPDNTPTITWSVDNPAACSFSDPTTADTVINCTAPGTYAATLSADDGVNPIVTDTAQVTVNPIPPGLTVSAGPDVSGNTNTAITLNAKITDPGQTPTASWVVDSPNCTFSSPLTVATTITCNTAGVYAATLTGHDGVHADGTDTALVTVVQPSVAPTVNAGPDVSAAINVAAALHGVVTSPAGPATILWSTDGPTCTFANANAADTTMTCTAPGVYAAVLSADDGIHPPVFDAAEVTVLTQLPPVVNAGPDVSGNTGTSIALHGTVTASGTPAISWATSNPACSFGNANAADTTIMCSAQGVYAATLTANDGVNPPVHDTALVTVITPNAAPVVSAGSDTFGIIKHAIPLNGSVTDPDSTPAIHWSNGSPNCSFTNPSAASTTFQCTAAGVYAVTLTADDGVNQPVSATALVTLSNPACTGVCLSIGDVMVYEGGQMAFPITLSSPQPTNVTFTASVVTQAGGAINGQGLPTGSAFDFKTAVAHNMTIKAGVVEAFLTIKAVTDTLTENDESYQVVLGNIVGASPGRTIGLGTIKDDTGGPVNELLYGSASLVELDACSTCKATLKISVVRLGATGIKAKYSTANAGATAGSDYTAKTNIAFAIASTAQQGTVGVVTIGDNNPEPLEGVDFVFSTPSLPTLFDNGNVAHGFIIDND